ncbi:MAG: TerC family protein [Anaerolineae bacterium]|nr:TerC family protein [Anaerolineae bacterium]
MEWFTDPEIWISLLTLTVLEIVLGIDNIVFISILAGKLEPEEQERARKVGLGAALIMRIVLLLSLAWVISLTAPLFTVFRQEISGRDLILLIGGLFLLGKSTYEIHHKLEGHEGRSSAKVKPTFTSVILQVMMLDIVFSLDSVITAVGMVNSVGVMIAAVLIAVIIMLASVNSISAFIEKHPTVKILALSFLLLIGFSLVAEGLDQHISKGYIYFSMAFSIFVEMLNIRMQTKQLPPVDLRNAYVEEK